MASIAVEPNGHRRILIKLPSGKRPTIRLGKCSQKDAQHVRHHIELLAVAASHGTAPPADTTGWLAGRDDRLHARIAAAGLCAPRTTGKPSKLGPMIRSYIDRRTDLKPSTKRALGQARAKLVAHFGEDRDFTTINTAELKDWRRAIAADKKSEGYIAKLVAKAKTFFSDAVERELIPRTPFKGVKGGSEENRKRIQYIDRPTIEKVIAATSDAEWKAVIALARYTGMRIPSEPFRLTWGRRGLG